MSAIMYWIWLLKKGSEIVSPIIVTYDELLRDVCRFANVLKGLGIKRGDRVAIYMSVTVELVTVMLACARIGAIHSVI
ncbi:unnamed protein product, partial [Medioppia subpectinata]